MANKSFKCYAQKKQNTKTVRYEKNENYLLYDLLQTSALNMSIAQTVFSNPTVSMSTCLFSAKHQKLISDFVFSFTLTNTMTS